MMDEREKDLTTDELASAGRSPDTVAARSASIARPEAEDVRGDAETTTEPADERLARDADRVESQGDSTVTAEEGGVISPSRTEVTDGDAAEAAPPVATHDATGTAAPDTATEPLLAADEAESLRDRWERTQHKFVDEPRQAVEDADRLVAELMQHLAQLFAREREGLEQQWGHGGEASTEDLRVALQRYRIFFQRLLST
jgi:ElaB/YqjD/DUF883 family membrane-anchored ribosome-binding protein